MNIIDEYKQGNLSEQELEYITVALMKAHLDKEYAEHLVKELAEKHGVYRTGTSTTRKIWYSVSALAAMVALCIGFFFYLPTQEVSTGNFEEQLAAHLSIPFPNGTIRKGNSDILQSRRNAHIAYSESEFHTSITYYEEIPEVNRTTSDRFFLALAYLYTDDFKIAIPYFLTAQKSSKGESDYAQEIDWYLALAYLKDEQFDNAQAILQKIVAEEYWVKEDAQMLLEQLNNNSLTK